MEYRFSKNRPEIVKTLADKLTGECSLTVWQKQDDGTRSLMEKMTFHALFADEGVFTLKVTKENSLRIDPKKDVYFLLEEHDFIFKTKLAVDQKEFMTLQIPREVRLQEFRIHERKYFNLEEKKFVEVVFSAKNTENEITLSCPLVNISEGGACIVVSKETISNIDFSADVLMKFTTDFQTAVIRNARLFIKKNLNNDELYAIGVQFQ
ncbi:MAG: PilZ domain-containing protein [Bacteriovorax sp.]|nr:PilZ domain-containing protein [Bacteriovorax sp.]